VRCREERETFWREADLLEGKASRTERLLELDGARSPPSAMTASAAGLSRLDERACLPLLLLACVLFSPRKRERAGPRSTVRSRSRAAALWRPPTSEPFATADSCATRTALPPRFGCVGAHLRRFPATRQAWTSDARRIALARRLARAHLSPFDHGHDCSLDSSLDTVQDRRASHPRPARGRGPAGKPSSFDHHFIARATLSRRPLGRASARPGRRARRAVLAHLCGLPLALLPRADAPPLLPLQRRLVEQPPAFRLPASRARTAALEPRHS